MEIYSAKSVGNRVALGWLVTTTLTLSQRCRKNVVPCFILTLDKCRLPTLPNGYNNIESTLAQLLSARRGGIGRNFLNKFLSLHILTINRLINLPTIISGYSELYCLSGASRKSGGTKRRGERELQKNDGAEREVTEREMRGEYRCYRNRLERGAAFSPLTLRSHAVPMSAQSERKPWLYAYESELISLSKHIV